MLKAVRRTDVDHRSSEDLKIGYVVGIYRRYSSRLPRFADRDEVLGAAMEAYVRLDPEFDPDLGIPWAAYMADRIRWAMIDAVRSTLRFPDPVEISRDSGSDRGQEGFNLSYHEPSIEDPELEDYVEIEHLEWALNHLRERERLVLYLRFYENLSLEKAGEVLGVTASRICQLEARAVRNLRRIFSQERERPLVIPQSSVVPSEPEPNVTPLLPRLTHRQKRVLYLLGCGFGQQSIAIGLNISPTAVADDAKRARKKLGAKTSTQAVAIALRSGLIDYPPRDSQPTENFPPAVVDAVR